MLNSFEELCIIRAAAENSFARVLNYHGGAYILSSKDRLFRCITTLQCGKTRRTLEAGIDKRIYLQVDTDNHIYSSNLLSPLFRCGIRPYEWGTQ